MNEILEGLRDEARKEFGGGELGKRSGIRDVRRERCGWEKMLQDKTLKGSKLIFASTGSNN